MIAVQVQIKALCCSAVVKNDIKDGVVGISMCHIDAFSVLYYYKHGTFWHMYGLFQEYVGN
jgi:hypothetical protein